MAWKHRKLLMNLGNAVDATCAPGPAADELVSPRPGRGRGRPRSRPGSRVVTAEQDERAPRRRPAAPAERPAAAGRTRPGRASSRGADGTEVDYLAGEIVLQGRLHGVPTPVNALLLETVHDVVRRGAEPRSLDAADLLARLK